MNIQETHSYNRYEVHFSTAGSDEQKETLLMNCCEVSLEHLGNSIIFTFFDLVDNSVLQALNRNISSAEIRYFDPYHEVVRTVKVNLDLDPPKLGFSALSYMPGKNISTVTCTKTVRNYTVYNKDGLAIFQYDAKKI